jgi:phosphoribosylglycinamide formyltransferase 1
VDVCVLASGTGTNLQALLEDPAVGPRVRLVVSDRAEAGALERARRAGVEAVHHDPQSFRSREEHDAALADLLRSRDIEVVCLAGYMRILTPVMVQAFWGRLLNVHPALLPAFPGAHAVRDALAWGVRVTGVTVHQEAVPVLDEDDEAALHARIQEAEHRIYPEAVRLLVEGRLRIEGRRVVLQPAPAARA